jgi:hypothetical protein
VIRIFCAGLAACSFSPDEVAALDGEAFFDAHVSDAKPDAPPGIDAPDATASVLDGPSCGRPLVDPVCGPPTDLGSVSGDTFTGDPEVVTGYADRWFQVRITENSSDRRTTKAYVRLDMPPDVDFDLEAYCVQCGGELYGSSNAGLGALTDHFVLYNSDHGNGSTSDSDSFTVFLHVKYFSGESCGGWTLTIEGYEDASVDYFYCL